MNDVARIVDEIERVERAMQKHQQAVRGQRLAIKDDDDLTGEQRQIKERQLAREGQRRWRELNEKWEKLNGKAERLAKAAQTQMPLDETATARVRSLTKDGVADNLIIKRAVEVGDDDVLEALRRERLWHNDGKSFREAAETIAACTAALAQVGSGEGQREVNGALLRLAETRERMPVVSEYAGKVVFGNETSTDTLRVAYATGAGREGESDA